MIKYIFSITLRTSMVSNLWSIIFFITLKISR